MDRRAFLRRTSLALPALLVGDAALEAFGRLTHRKVFALGGWSRDGLVGYLDVTTSSSVHALRTTTIPSWRAVNIVGGGMSRTTYPINALA